MTYFYFLVFTAFYFFIGIIILDNFLKKYFEKNIFLFVAPAISLPLIALVSLTAYTFKIDKLIPFFFVVCLILILYRLKFLCKFFVSLDKFNWFVIFIYFSIFFLQSYSYHVNAQNNPMPGNTWQMYAISGGTSPPDQTFSWHQARFLKNNLEYGKDEFYGDIDFFDRPIFGGLITYFFMYGQDISKNNYPDTNFDSDFYFKVYRNIWWGINNLYIFGIAFLFSFLYGKKSTYPLVAVAAISPFVFILSTGLWVKMLPVYFFCIILFLHKRKMLPILKGILSGISFYAHGSMLIFLIPLVIEDFLSYLKSLRDTKSDWKKGFKYFLKFSLVTVFLISAWFIVAKLYNAPQNLTLAYLYNLKYSSTEHPDKILIAKNFYESTTKLNLLFLPIFNIAKSLLPIEFINYISNFSFTDKTYLDFTNFADSIFLTERNRFTAMLGIWMLPAIVVGVFKMFKQKSSRANLIYLYLLPTILMALIYRKDNIISNHIVAPYIVTALMATHHFINEIKKLKNIFLLLLLSGLIINNYTSILFSRNKICEIESTPLAFGSNNQFDYKWLLYFFIVVIIGLVSYYFFINSEESVKQ